MHPVTCLKSFNRLNIALNTWVNRLYQLTLLRFCFTICEIYVCIYTVLSLIIYIALTVMQSNVFKSTFEQNFYTKKKGKLLIFFFGNPMFSHLFYSYRILYTYVYEYDLLWDWTLVIYEHISHCNKLFTTLMSIMFV